MASTKRSETKAELVKRNTTLADQNRVLEAAHKEALAQIERLGTKTKLLTEAREANERLRVTTTEQVIQIRKLEAERDNAQLAAEQVQETLRLSHKEREKSAREMESAMKSLQARFEDTEFGYRRRTAEVERLREAIVQRFLRENPAQEG